MNVRLTQINERMNQITEELQAEGKIADSREIANRARATIEKLGSPTVDLIKLNKRAAIDSDGWQSFVDSVVFDLIVLRKIMVDFYQNNKERYLKNLTDQNKALADITYLDNEVQLLSAVASKTYSDYITDSFVDTEFIETGVEAVDLKFGNVQLPIKRSFTKKIDLKIPNTYTPSIDIFGPTISQILYSGSLAGSQFTNALNDTNHIWIHRIKTKEYTKDITIEFIIPLGDSLSSELDIEPHSDTPMDISVQITKDGNQYYDVNQALTNGTELQFRYESAIVKAIKIRARIDGPSLIEHGISDYIFGFKNISVLDIAYQSNYEVETKYRASKFAQPIKTIEIETDEDLPDGTNIEYEVKGRRYDTTETNYMAIAPINRPDKTKPEKLEISGTSHYLSNLKNTINERVERYEEIDFYKIGVIDPTHHVDLNSIRLSRANNAWNLSNKSYINKATVETRVDLRKDRDVPIHFYATEDSRFIDPQTLAVKHKVDFNEAGQELIPRSKDSIEPSTAIASVKRYSFQSVIGFGKNGSGSKYYIDNGLSFPTLSPAILSEVAANISDGRHSIIEPAVVKAPGNVFSIDVDIQEEIIVAYSNGSVASLKVNKRSLLRIKTVTQQLAGSFASNDPSFNLNSIAYISVIDTSTGMDIPLAASGVIIGNITAQPVLSVTFNSYNNTDKPENAGAISRGYYLIPNQEHVDQTPALFKSNDVYDLLVPFPVKIITDSFSGIFQVDRISAINIDGAIRPILVITDPNKLGSTIPIAATHRIKSWEILSQDLTQEVIKLFDDKIYFSEHVILEPGDKVEVKYRVSTESSTIKVLPETIEVIDSQNSIIFEEGKDYVYKDGLIHSVKEGVAQDLVVKFSYEEYTNNLYELTTNLQSLNDSELNIKIASFNNEPFKPDYTAGEGIWFDDILVTVNSVLSITKGFHTVKIAAKDTVRLVAFSKALDTNGRLIFTTNTTFSAMKGILQPLTYAPYDVLKNCTYKGNPKNFSIVNNEVIIPFNPNINAFVDNRIYKIYKNEDLQNALGSYYIEDFSQIPVVVEAFVIEYDYTKLDIDEIDQQLIEYVKIKIKLSKSVNKNSGLSPLLKKLSIRIR